MVRGPRTLLIPQSRSLQLHRSPGETPPVIVIKPHQTSMKTLGLESGGKADWLKGNGLKSPLLWILRPLTPHTSLGLNSSPYYTSLVLEWYQQSHSRLIWVYTRPRAWPPVLQGSSTIKKHHGPHHQKHRCAKSAKLHWEPGSSVLVSKNLAHSLVQRYPGRKHRDVSTPRARSFLQLNALLESRAAGSWQGGSIVTRALVWSLASSSFWPPMDFHGPFIKPGCICVDSTKAASQGHRLVFPSLRDPLSACRNLVFPAGTHWILPCLNTAVEMEGMETS